ncbi:non-ribosomal peptide synthetase [Dermatophilus congolensis]|uniref:non-ribosomal peptide synthetase n=1 Tax=Dermatophilus congolensis TaxID=1863 RepID=UPI001AAE9AEA|nr:non-ribosomal peptide synthetase [Dermatophilus congolensis]MBO3130125.1 amino acid adenylation domain-containing protein [Dermatophilus congolensis]MBO3131248.1 amino acid adenylation domain-containing protein [Dermatophilus congolensis]MBO3134596.1 amino acid adenylation domain-containing protein [Dermatophilus congolensis]MBO3136833.1 amino acid adenylation domain-containing protein [Dermatophilus congolensis]MBO3139077.1 amino acid adenylation domain-containing protein [Dermatophilus co
MTQELTHLIHLPTQEVHAMANRLGKDPDGTCATSICLPLLAVAAAWWVQHGNTPATEGTDVRSTPLTVTLNDALGQHHIQVTAHDRLPHLAAAMAEQAEWAPGRVSATLETTTVTVEPAQTGSAQATVCVHVPPGVDEHDLHTLLTDLIARPERTLLSLRAQSDTQRVALEAMWNDTDQPRHRPDITELIRSWAEQTPEAEAVVSDEHRLTYRQLVTAADAVAAQLRHHGVGAETVVGISLPRSAEMVVAILGVLFAGGAFVPVDPAWPAPRRASVITDAAVSLLLVADPTTSEETSTITLDLNNPLPQAKPEPLPEEINGSSLAYIVFTSGSTGRPKGAMIRRAAIVERLLWQRDEILGFRTDDASLFKAPLAFDISINEILLPLISGARVVVAAPDGERDPSYLLNLIGTERVTFAYLVSSMLEMLLTLDAEDTNTTDQTPTGSLRHLRHVWCGGELLTQALYRRFRRALDIPLYHGYGPAEATIGVSHVVYRAEGDRMGHSIGSANPNTRLYVLGPDLRPAPISEPGELYAAGMLVGRGYVGAPALTASRFVADPFAADGSRMYRTGDLVRRLDDGSLEFVGRADNQVKIRGMRLELEDVEAGLAEHPEVRSVCVIARSGRLIGYAVTTADSSLTGEQLRDWARSQLPEYMVPAAVVILPTMPITVNGKVDRSALPEPQWENDTTTTEDITDPRLAQVCTAMADVLDLQRVSPDCDFFDIGGDSLIAVRLAGALRSAGLPIGVAHIFKARTPRALANTVQNLPTPIDVEDKPHGTLHDLPVLRWFAEVTQAIDGFVQAVPLRAPHDLNLQAAQAILNAVIHQHPALRARVSHHNGLHLDIPTPENATPVYVDERGPGGDKNTDTDELIADLDPAAGVLVRARLRPGVLLVVIHHLVMDGISWQILTDDLTAAMQAWRAGELNPDGTPTPGKTHPVQPEGSSLRRWTQCLADAVASGHFDTDAHYYRRVLATPDAPLTNATGPTPTVANERTLTRHIDATTTEAITLAVPTAFGTGVNTVLLTAFALALATWREENGTHQTAALIDLEGHGRESRFVPTPGGEADLSHTLGWFTSMFPVLLDPGTTLHADEDTLVRALKTVKDQLAEVPNGGIGFGALRRLDQRPGAAAGLDHEPQILFNYLGRVGSTNDAEFEPLPGTDLLGERRDPEQPLPRTLELNAVTTVEPDGGVLRATFSWGANVLEDTSITRLAQLWTEALTALAGLAHRGSRSPGDFASAPGLPAPISFEDLDRLDSPTLVDILPLTPVQNGMYFHSVFEGEQSDAYVEQQLVHLHGPIDAHRLETALRALLRHHPALSAAVFTTTSGEAVSVIDTAAADRLHLAELDLTAVEPHEAQQRLRQRAHTDRTTGFDPTHAPLMRCTLVTLEPEHCVLIQTVHHLVADGWSVPLMLRTLIECYTNPDLPEPAYRPERGIPGFVRWLDTRDRHADQQLWQTALQGATPVVVAPGAATPTHIEEIPVIADNIDAALEHCRNHGWSIPVLAHAAWGLVLRDLAGLDCRSDVIFGSTVSGRDAPVEDLENAVGMVINTVPSLAPGAAPTDPAHTLLTGVSTHLDHVRAHMHVPLADTVPQGSTVGDLFDTLVVMDLPTDPAQLHVPGAEVEIRAVINDGAPHYPLTLVVSPTEKPLLRLLYDPASINHSRAQRITRMLAAAVEGLCSSNSVAHVTAHIAAACAQSTNEPETLTQLWQTSVKAHPQRPALVAVTADKGTPERIEYTQMHARARSVAATLSQALPHSDQPARVALLLDRSPEQVVGILAVVLAGGTYVPLDPLSPDHRIDLILDNCQPEVLLVGPQYAERAHTIAPEGTTVMVMPDPQQQDNTTEQQDNTTELQFSPRNPSPHDPAYILYTSGSTGRPKGVVVTHANVLALLHTADNHIQMSNQDVWCLFHSFAFDFSVWELWAPLRYGACVVLLDYALTRSPHDFAGVLAEQKVTVLNQTPSAFVALDSTGATLPALRHLIFGGEALEIARVAEFAHRHPNCHIINMYGITETTVHVTALKLTTTLLQTAQQNRTTASPVGRPLDGLRGYVLDGQLQPVRPGGTGILYVAGPQVTRGYFGQPGLSAARFVADPFAADGTRMYCSGDVMRVRADGGLEYIGRADRQIQVRGFRIEPGEVETVLLTAPEVADAAVLALDRPEGRQLAAVVVPREGTDLAEAASTARRTARRNLPAYLVPSLLIAAQQLPLTINGKRDETALRAMLEASNEHEMHPEPDAAPAAEQQGETAVTAIAAALAAVLDLDPQAVGPNEDYFQLGGDSILALKLCHRLRREGIAVSPREVFTGRTPAGIARLCLQPAPATSVTRAKTTHGALVPLPMLYRQQTLGMPSDFAQARTIELDETVNTEQLSKALGHVVTAHPLLGARLSGLSHQLPLSIEIPATPPTIPVLQVDTAEHALPALLETLDPENGTLLAAAVVKEGRVAVMAVHHAVVDSMSWLVIENDLRCALENKPIAPETVSAGEHATELLRRTHTDEITQWLPHWQRMHHIPQLVVADSWPGEQVRLLATRLEEDAAKALLTATSGTQVAARLTATVVAALSRCIGERPEILVDLETHGRNNGDSLNIDLERTVGWFTCLAPVRVPGSSDPQRVIHAVEGGSDAAPATSYAALRYLHPHGARMLSNGGAQVLVNYLGRAESEAVLCVPAPATPPRTPHLLEVDIWAMSSQELRAEFRVAEPAWNELGVDPADLIPAWQKAVADLAESLAEQGEQAALTPLQRGLLFQAQVAPGGTYTAQTTLAFDRRLDPQTVAESFADTVTIHPAIGARFLVDEDGTPTQWLPEATQRICPEVTVHEVNSVDQIDALLDAQRRLPFDLGEWPLARFLLIRTPHEGDLLVFTYHLVLMDGWSRALLLNSFLQRLRLRENTPEQDICLPEPSRPSFAEVARKATSHDEAAALAHWRSRLEGLNGPTLVGDGRLATTPTLPESVVIDLDEQSTNALNAAASRAGVTLTALIVAATTLSLRVLTGEDDVVVGLSVSGRNLVEDPGVDSVVGVLLNTVPARVQLQAQQTVMELLTRIQAERLESMPFDGVDLGQVQRDLGMEVLFDSLVVVQNFLDPKAAQETRRTHGITAESSVDATHFPLTWVYTPGERLRLTLEHRPELLPKGAAQTAAHLAVSALQSLTDSVLSAESGRRCVASLPGWQAGPDHGDVVAAQNARVDFTVVDALDAAAERNPDAVALVDEQHRWTFAQFQGRCLAVAQELQRRGVGPGATVALGLPRSAHVVAALMGVLRTGARYVPVDLSHPDGRLAAVLGDVNPEVVLVTGESRSRMARIVPDVPLIEVDALASVQMTAELVSRASVAGDAYVIYTSGSTGRPKGVVVPHDGLASMLVNHRRKIFAPAVHAAGDRRFRVAHALSFAFDMSWEELLWLADGHEVHLCDEDLRRDPQRLVEYTRQNGIDVINVTPGQAEQLIAEGLLDEGMHAPSLVLLGGEAVSVRLWRRLGQTSGVRGYNLYGPTEYTINALGVGDDECADPVIGAPVDHTVALVLDRWLRPVPDGVPGELYLTGIGLARGYHGMPGRTAESFVACPWGEPGSRMYRTGDRVRRRVEDGLMEYLGRTDNQVKIRGHRVDPGEVSAAVLTLAEQDRGAQAPSDVAEVYGCVTTVVNGALVCHLAARVADSQGVARAVRDGLRSVLPEALVPDRYAVVSEFPLTANGKVDTAQLGSGSPVGSTGRPARGEQECLVAELVAEVLDLDEDEVPADVDFFSLGGHSMAAVRLVALLRAEGASELAVRDVYALRTVERMAQKLVM